MTSTQWTARCSARIEIARLALVRVDRAFHDATLQVDPAPWNPHLRFEARVRDGYWEAAVERGRGPCIDFDIDDPDYNNMPWRDGSSASRVLVDRIMRLDGDEAWLQANRVSSSSAIAFRREFQRALLGCLEDARGVYLADPPPGMCSDDVDTCPDEPEVEDGCPEH
jgi:hypothetical protein